MNRILITLAAGACAGVLAFAASAQAATEVSVARLDCGTPQPPIVVNQRFSDTFAYGDMKRQFVYSCYLVKHGDEYFLWDTGHSMSAPKVAPKVSIVEQLAKLNVKPEPRDAKVNVSVSSVYSLGGQNAALVFKKV